MRRISRSRHWLGRYSVGLILAVVLGACSQEEPAQEIRTGGGNQRGQGNIPAVEAVAARFGSLPLEERLTGRVTARNQTDIYPEVSGSITRIFVENGDQVQAGDQLVQLRNLEYVERYQQAAAGLEVAQAQTRQAEADLGLLRSQLRQVEELINRDLEARGNLDTVRSQVAVAEANLALREAQERQARSVLEERRLQQTNTTVLAPIAGTVGQRSAEIGQLVNTSTRLFVLGDLENVRVELLLSQRMLNYIRPGMPVSLYSDSWPDTALEASITRISPFLDPETTRTQAHVEMANPGGMMRPGMFVTVDIFYGQSEEAVLIPNSALYRHPRTGMEGVYVAANPDRDAAVSAEDERAGVTSSPQPVRFIPVEVIASGRMASGVRGVEAGDWVITLGQNLLQGDESQARLRLVPWDRMMELQALQSRDLFDVIEQQRRPGGDS